MKISTRKQTTGAIAAALLLVLAGAAGAADHSGHAGHGSAAGAAAPAGAAAAQPSEPGVEIRAAAVEGYQLKYRLLNWAERNEAMKGMLGMEMPGMDNSGNSTHHLVLHIAGAGGAEVTGAKVGFIVTRPDGGEQKTLTMAMDGYMADVNLRAKGRYTIKAKIVDGGKTFVDTFAYEVK